MVYFFKGIKSIELELSESNELVLLFSGDAIQSSVNPDLTFIQQKVVAVPIDRIISYVNTSDDETQAFEIDYWSFSGDGKRKLRNKVTVKCFNL